MTAPTALKTVLDDLDRLPSERLYGRVNSVLGMLVEVTGLEGVLSVGGRCDILARGDRRVPCEVVGFRDKRALLLPFGSVEGIALGCKAELAVAQPRVRPDPAWLGRVVNALGQPIDGKGPLPQGREAYPLRAAPPPAHSRKRVGDKIDLGVRALNTFQTCCRGQRMGIFAGSGVGKSVLLSMLARYTASDVNVIGLIGERGREVQEWLEDELGPEGLARSIVVVATSDEPPPMRRQAVYLTMALAEYFRDHGKDVLCLIDSITRFAMALREIGLAAGEPPAAKGYTPSVFGELPQVLERAGPGVDTGSITGLFTVLVEGDDHNEPIADAVRGILDGHIVLDRQIAERGRYPAINTLRSISRTMPACNTQAQTDLVTRARRLLSTYEDMGELIRIGAYKHGSDPKVDEAIKYVPAIEAFLSQDKGERAELDSGYAALARVLGVDWPDSGHAGATASAGAAPSGDAGAQAAAADGQAAKTADGKPIPPKNDLRRARRQQQKAAGGKATGAKRAAAGGEGA